MCDIQQITKCKIQFILQQYNIGLNPLVTAARPASVPRSTVIVTVGGSQVLWGCRETACSARARTHTPEWGSWTRTVRAAVAMMQWRLRRGKRARSWMSSLHSWSKAAADSQPRTPSVPPRDRQQAPRHWQDPVLPHYMETHNQVCLLASQLAMSWRLERFLTHLYDVAARREEHQHPVCPP